MALPSLGWAGGGAATSDWGGQSVECVRHEHALQRPRVREARAASEDSNEDSWISSTERVRHGIHTDPFPLQDAFSRRAGKIFRTRSRLYRNQILKVNTHLKALAEICTLHSFALLSISILLSTFGNKFLDFAKI